MKIKKNTLYYILVLILVIGAGFVFLNGGNSHINDGEQISGNGEMQKIVLSEKDFNYYPNTIRVKVNQPVSISLDDSVKGCLRAFTIRDFGVFKTLKTPEDSVEFIPNKKGIFTFACSMNMGKGKLVVE